jgi:parallel beta-helix repeat protein
MKKVWCLVILSLFLVSVFLFSPCVVRASPTTFSVNSNGGADFISIQDAVNHASSGDTISVAAGVYYENVYVSTSCIIAGQSAETIIVDGGISGYTFSLYADHVTLRNMTIRNGRNYYSQYYSSGAGVYILADYTTVTDCILKNNYYGIEQESGSHSLIAQNVFSNNYMSGIYLAVSSSYNNVSKNSIRNSSYNGFALASDNNQLYRNTIEGNNQTGVVITGGYNRLVENTITQNDYYDVTIRSGATGNVFVNNTIGSFNNESIRITPDDSYYYNYTTYPTVYDNYPSFGYFMASYLCIPVAFVSFVIFIVVIAVRAKRKKGYPMHVSYRPPERDVPVPQPVPPMTEPRNYSGVIGAVVFLMCFAVGGFMSYSTQHVEYMVFGVIAGVILFITVHRILER